jgi:hypothetical protein
VVVGCGDYIWGGGGAKLVLLVPDLIYLCPCWLAHVTGWLDWRVCYGVFSRKNELIIDIVFDKTAGSFSWS